VTNYGKKFDRFVDIVKELRSENGCPWDKEQSPTSLKRYLLEETQEAIEAITANNHQHIKDELGDILYIIVLLAHIHNEENLFNMGDVIEAITDKMIRRHPHVFNDEKIETVAELRKKWLEIKDIEKSSSILPKKN
jgi:tetrapyrrole methylase family protein/MazG family protein/ATP diphosphatase